MTNENPLDAEAQVFSDRIKERVAAGYIPDLRRLKKNDYFYQSYWRDPYFAQLFVGESVNIFLDMIRRHHHVAKSILDVGCGPGYITLELARAGYHVTGIDIADSAIEVARETAATNPFTQGFGSLEYQTCPLEAIGGSYDVVLFSGSIHHFDNPRYAIQHSVELVNPGGLIVCHEPTRDTWQMTDAALAALIRMLLMLSGHWHQRVDSRDDYVNPDKLIAFIHDIHQEYVEEHSKDEGTQSPQDNASHGTAILGALRELTHELEHRPGFAYLYRMLGGLRGEDATTHAIADFLASYERLALQQGFISPSTFFFAGRVS